MICLTADQKCKNTPSKDDSVKVMTATDEETLIHYVYFACFRDSVTKHALHHVSIQRVLV